MNILYKIAQYLQEILIDFNNLLPLDETESPIKSHIHDTTLLEMIDMVLIQFLYLAHLLQILVVPFGWIYYHFTRRLLIKGAIYYHRLELFFFNHFAYIFNAVQVLIAKGNEIMAIRKYLGVGQLEVWFDENGPVFFNRIQLKVDFFKLIKLAIARL